jgi:hypothetical protein
MTPIESAVHTVNGAVSSSGMRNAAVSTGRVWSLIIWMLTGLSPLWRGARSQRRQLLSDEDDSSRGGLVGSTVTDLTKSVWPSRTNFRSPD